jgi:hypothetical protein
LVSKIVEKPEVATVALASLVKMVGLLGAELTVGAHRDDIDLVEACIRTKLFASVEGVSAEDAGAGVALAQRLVDPVLRALRARAEAMRGDIGESGDDAAATGRRGVAHLN